MSRAPEDQPLSDNMKLALQQARTAGRVARCTAGDASVLRALFLRGLVEEDGVLTPKGQDASRVDYGLLPCGLCGAPVRVLHAIPKGDERCRPCARSPRERAGGSDPDVRYHGNHRPGDF